MGFPQRGALTNASNAVVIYRIRLRINSTQLNEPPTKVSGLQGEKAESLSVSPILEKTVKFSFEIYDIVAT